MRGFNFQVSERQLHKLNTIIILNVERGSYVI